MNRKQLLKKATSKYLRGEKVDIDLQPADDPIIRELIEKELKKRDKAKLQKAMENLDVDTIRRIATGDASFIPKIMKRDFLKQLPEEDARELVLAMYILEGFKFPQCRRAVRELRKNGLNELSPELASKDWITVYRAGHKDNPQDERRSISWTTSYKYARAYYDRIGWGAFHLYRAKIRPEDVIAVIGYVEVLQYCSVYDIEVIEG